MQSGRLAGTRARARTLTFAALSAASLAIAGCSASGGTSSVAISGQTLRIYLSVPADYSSNPQLGDLLDAEQLAYNQQAAAVEKSTGFTLQKRLLVSGELSAHARDAISDTKAVAYIGELLPGDSENSAGITNAQDLLQVSPTDTALELTTTTAAVSDSPKKYYESTGTYGKTFARVVPSTAVEAQAQVGEMSSLGVSSLYVTGDSSDYGRALALAVERAAKAKGISVDTQKSGEASAGAVFDASDSADAASAAATLMAAVQSNPSVKLFAPSALATPAFTSALSTPPKDLYVTEPGFKQIPVAAQGFATSFKSAYGHAPAIQAIFGYEAMTATLQAIQRAGHDANNRRTVVRDFFSTRNLPTSVLGPYSINSGGDTTLGPSAFVICKYQAGSLVPFVQAQG